MKSQVLHTVWCSISGEAAGEIWTWSLLGVKWLMAGRCSADLQPVQIEVKYFNVAWRNFPSKQHWTRNAAWKSHIARCFHLWNYHAQYYTRRSKIVTKPTPAGSIKHTITDVVYQFTKWMGFFFTNCVRVAKSCIWYCSACPHHRTACNTLCCVAPNALPADLRRHTLDAGVNLLAFFRDPPFSFFSLCLYPSLSPEIRKYVSTKKTRARFSKTSLD